MLKITFGKIKVWSSKNWVWYLLNIERQTDENGDGGWQILAPNIIQFLYSGNDLCLRDNKGHDDF